MTGAGALLPIRSTLRGFLVNPEQSTRLLLRQAEGIIQSAHWHYFDDLRVAAYSGTLLRNLQFFCEVGFQVTECMTVRSLNRR